MQSQFTFLVTDYITIEITLFMLNYLFAILYFFNCNYTLLKILPS